MPGTKNAKREKAPLDDRFDFVGDAVAPGSRTELRPAIFEVEEKELFTVISHLQRHPGLILHVTTRTQ